MMGKYYNIPSASWVSTESMSPDSQTAIEKTFGYFSHINSGVSNIWGLGQFESELTLSPSQAVIDNEVISFVKRYLKGVKFNDESIPVDLICQGGYRRTVFGSNAYNRVFSTGIFCTKYFMAKQKR